ncbi:MAG: carboxypeptidase regulatory-like domain-containing protein, partial [Williamsia herbipolensis]|nr:carboxypeptidase regulatory-like domain-containing protein [Williamsia herbipolensis]
MLVAATVGALALLGQRPASAADAASAWADWGPITGSSNDYATTMRIPVRGFPAATVATDSRGNVALPSGSSTYLRPSTPPGDAFGTSRDHPYLNLRPQADTASSPSTTTYTFDSPTPPAGWTFVLGDVDADKVQVSAKDADGQDVSAARIDGWFQGSFNYAGAADEPSWDAATSTLTGNQDARDTDGASGWFEPDVALSSLTLVFTQRSGFPVYQTWFAGLGHTVSGTVTDESTSGSCAVDDTLVRLVGPDGADIAATHPTGGAYSFGDVAMQPGYVVRIERPDGCSVVGADERTVDTTGQDATADFAVRRVVPQRVSGRVTLPDGTPVAGVEVTLTPPAGPAKVTTTDDTGHYLFDDNTEAAGYTVTVTAIPDGYSVRGADSLDFDIPVGTPVTGLDFTLAELPDVAGTVTGGGDPLGAVTVTLTPQGGGTPVTTSTLGDGTYAFEHVPDGTYDLAVVPPDGYRAAPAIDDVAVSGSDVTGQDFDLTRPGAIGGRVTDAVDDGPVAGAVVTVTGPGGPVTLRTDDAGRYFLDDLDPG